jgi:hypothetical protein
MYLCIVSFFGRETPSIQESRVRRCLYTANSGEGTPDGATVAPAHLGFAITPPCQTPFYGAHPTDMLLQCFLRMPVSLVDGLCGFAEVMEVTQLVGHIREHSCDGTADGELAVRNDAYNRDRHGLPHRPEQACQVLLGC